MPAVRHCAWTAFACASFWADTERHQSRAAEPHACSSPPPIELAIATSTQRSPDRSWAEERLVIAHAVAPIAITSATAMITIAIARRPRGVSGSFGGVLPLLIVGASLRASADLYTRCYPRMTRGISASMRVHQRGIAVGFAMSAWFAAAAEPGREPALGVCPDRDVGQPEMTKRGWRIAPEGSESLGAQYESSSPSQRHQPSREIRP